MCQSINATLPVTSTTYGRLQPTQGGGSCNVNLNFQLSESLTSDCSSFGRLLCDVGVDSEKTLILFIFSLSKMTGRLQRKLCDVQKMQ